MAIPDYHQLMLPLLRLTEDQKLHSMSDLSEELAAEFKLTASERKEPLPSGRKPKFNDRVTWAAYYMRRALLLESPERGSVRITERGLSVLAEKPKTIDDRFLKKFQEFRDFIKPRRKAEGDSPSKKQSATPEEIFEESYENLLEQLKVEILARVKNESPVFFEKLVIDLLVKMGYGGSRKDAGTAIGGIRDGGVDGVIKEDKLGLDVIYVQAKRWEGTVGRPVVQGFAGSLEGVRARRGILITTSSFTQDAHEYVKNIEKKIVLVDGEMLAQLMIEHNVGVSIAASYELKKIDSDYFLDE